MTDDAVVVPYVGGPMNGKTKVVSTAEVDSLPATVSIRSPRNPDPLSQDHQWHYTLVKDSDTGERSYVLSGPA